MKKILVLHGVNLNMFGKPDLGARGAEHAACTVVLKGGDLLLN
jgi:3-dehydroquinate dehydratase